MNKYILSLLLIISHLTLLNAKESIQVDVHTFCSDSKEEAFMLKLSSDRLNLSEDAIQDNTGGYVDIPEDSYYLKTDSNVYYLDGLVEKSYKDNINQFSAKIYKNSKRLLNIKELYSLKSSENLKFIQKIKLENNNKADSFKSNTTTNILNVYFDDTQFSQEHPKCKEQINQSSKNLYPQAALLIFFMLGILYLLKRYFKK